MWTVVVRDSAGKLHSRTQLKTGVVSLGRGADCDIVLLSPSVSRLHGRLLVGGGPTLIYSDERSANGSFIDGQPVIGAVDAGAGSVISLGDFKVTLEREGAEEIPKGLTSTLIMSPKDVQLIAQAPPAAPPKPKPAATPPPSMSSAAAPSAPPPMKSALPGFEFTNLDTVVKVPIEAAVQQGPVSAASLLDQQIRGIQAHRNIQQDSVKSRGEEFVQQWSEAITASRELQTKLKGNPKVMYFVVARDESEVSIKLADSTKRGYSNLTLSKRHPETSKVTEGVVWYGVFGEEPTAYKLPKDAFEDFVRRIASKLA